MTESDDSRFVLDDADELTPEEAEQVREQMREAGAYRDRLEAMSYVELIGSVLGRAQIVEEIMRMMIVRASEDHDHPRQVKGTYGGLLKKFEKLYPEDEFLLDLLETGRDVRNYAAHSDLLVILFVNDLMSGHVEEEALDRFNRKALRKNVEGMDWLLDEMMEFLKAHPVDFEPWYGDAGDD